jgi:hypothetical protein
VAKGFPINLLHAGLDSTCDEFWRKWFGKGFVQKVKNKYHRSIASQEAIRSIYNGDVTVGQLQQASASHLSPFLHQ